MMRSQKLIFAAAALACLCACGEKQVQTPQELKEVFAKPAEGTAGTQAEQVQTLVNHAVTSLQKDDQMNAVIALQTLRNTPNLTVEQFTAVQDMMARAQKTLAERAAAGDPQAIAAMEALKYSHR